ncbi:AraC family transcriptional regulator [Terricaulis silvestris]|uniref:DNA-binding transcriptional activator FeaR n=1 Tax=Terricaulis silvestris TaxID=2686094 RepID=A0A6I6ML87_9CAUL|nr:helix-turn-helix domain-containing protein [Terricaulis silvestris]QGZ94008.1 DNA-binding transcriptional activator FeaR [Terricaulis silvestris]
MEAGIIELLLRGIAIGAIATMGIGLARGQGGPSTRIAGALFCAGVAAYVINSSPTLRANVGWLIYPVHLMAFGGMGQFWLFVVTLFEDRKIDWRTLAPWIVLTVIGLFGNVVRAEPWFSTIWISHNLIETGLALHALYIVTRSWRGDLVEERRKLRGPFLAATLLFAMTLSAFEIGESLGLRYDWYGFAFALGMAIFCLAGAATFLQARPELFGAVLPAKPDDALAPADRALLAKLETVMGPGEAWRREGLTIGSLAEEVGVPEHRLRRLINDGLGHRNFAAFVNAHRIEEAKRRLRDAAHAQVSVSTIAFDLGFGSLGPFNRAFKDATGVTPTEWRKQPSPIS